MKKRSLIFGIFLVVVLVSLSTINATIYYSNLESIYNLGDMIDLQITVDPVFEGYLLEVDLICDNEHVIVFNVLPENGVGNVKLPLNFHTIKEFNGDCFFLSEYNQGSKESRMFEISRRLKVTLDTNSFFTNPEDEITISGFANKLNGEVVNGEIEITIPLLKLASTNKTQVNESEINETVEEEPVVGGERNFIDEGQFYGKVVDGEFSVTFKLDKNTPAGEYRLDILIYEELGDKRTSEELIIGNLKVFQVLFDIEIALTTPSLDPGEKFVFIPLLKDQDGGIIYEEASVIIQGDDKTRLFERVVQSESSVEYEIPTDLKSDYYELMVSRGDFSKSKTIYINEKALVDFKLINGTLVVTNVGNIPYDKDIEINLNGKSFVKSVNLKVGESQEFKLTGKGEFSVKVSDGEREIVQEGVVLTGRAINVKSIGGSLALKTPIIWIVIIIILGGGLLFLFRNVFKKKSFAYPFKDKFRRKSKSKTGLKSKKTGSVSDVEEPKTVKKSKAPGALVAPSQAESKS